MNTGAIGGSQASGVGSCCGGNSGSNLKSKVLGLITYKPVDLIAQDLGLTPDQVRRIAGITKDN